MNATRASLPRWLSVAGWLLLAALLCLGLGRFGSWVTGRYLQQHASIQLSQAQEGQPLWHWSLRRPRDLIAGRVFGQAKAGSTDDALSLRSLDGSVMELGLPLSGPVDLRHWPILELSLLTRTPTTLGLAWGHGLQLQCVAPQLAQLPEATRRVRLDLSHLHWQSLDGSDCSGLGKAQILRLRVSMPSGATLSLREVALRAGGSIQPGPNIVLPAHLDLPTAAAMAQARGAPMPIFELPDSLDAGAMLATRDRLRAAWPAALIVPAGAELDAAQSPPAPWRHWAGSLIYLLLVLYLLARPPRGPRRHWLELLGCLGGPLWLVVGLHWGAQPAPALLTGVVALLYAAVIGPGMWAALSEHWPTRWADWSAMLTLLLAIGLVGWAGHRLQPLAPLHILLYPLWALLQQWLLLVVVGNRIYKVCGERFFPAALIVAALFALLHSPNSRLMELCFVAELIWAACYWRRGALLPIALAHAASALLVESGLVGAFLRSLEVSAAFLA